MKQINEIDLNSYRDRVYQNAVNHGWHEEKKSDEHWLCMVVSELMEAVEADRKDRYADTGAFEFRMDHNIMNLKLYGEELDIAFSVAFEGNIKDSVQDELADACIRLFDFAGVKNVDLDDFDYDASCTEDYFDKSFTESMFYIAKTASEYYDDMDISNILNEIFAFCRSREIDIFWFIDQKMKYNETRPFKHGGKKY